ncbi:MAG: type 1 glutamine amidotransferase [Pseudomonadota bacterium]
MARSKKVLVFQHVPYEPLGTLDPLLKQSGFRIRYVNFGRDPYQQPSLDGYSAIVVLGGPMNADDHANYPHLQTELELIREALDREILILGICLGAQLLARALGGVVHADTGREIGWHPVSVNEDGLDDPVLSSFGDQNQVFQWHDDIIELPPSAVCLASSDTCPVQAFRYGSMAYGFQFHLEADAPLIERWLQTPDHQSVFDEGAASAEDIRAKIPTSIDNLMALSDETFGRWANLVGTRRRKHRLPSR